MVGEGHRGDHRVDAWRAREHAAVGHEHIRYPTQPTLGIAGHGRELTLPADRIALRDLTVYGSVGYTATTWARMVDLVRKRLVELDPIVTHRFPLERFEEAFALMDDRRGVVAKIVLEHAA